MSDDVTADCVGGGFMYFWQTSASEEMKGFEGDSMAQNLFLINCLENAEQFLTTLLGITHIKIDYEHIKWSDTIQRLY